MGLMIALANVPVFAAHPLITDDAGTQGKGKSQLEVNGQYDTDKETTGGISVKSAGGEAAVLLSYGIAENADLVFSLPYIWGTVTENGVNAYDEKGMGTGKTVYHVFIVGSKEAAPWGFHANLGYIRNENKAGENTDIWHASLATTCEAAKDVKVVGNIGMEKNPDTASDNDPAFLVAGVIYSLSESFDVDFGVKPA